jgi:hypothetical protein
VRCPGPAPLELYRHHRRSPAPPRPPGLAPRPQPRALAPAERQQVLDVLHDERFWDAAPASVDATLLDEGVYLASISTMYRLLRQQGRPATGAGTPPTRPRAMGIVVLEVHAKHLVQVPATHNEQPVQALGTDGMNPPLCVGIGVGRLHRRHQHLGALRAEHVVEATAELRVTIANQEAHPPSSLLQVQQEVAGLLGNPGGVGVGSHPGQVDAPGVQFDAGTARTTAAARRCRR